MTDTNTIHKPVFFISDELLMPAELNRLQDYTFSMENEFRTSQVINPHNNFGSVDYEHRRSKVLFDIGDFHPVFVDRIYSYLPTIFRRLDILPFQVKNIETQITVTGDGGYFKMHNDNTHDILKDRMITFVYYFNTDPKMFSGGELRLYDTSFKNGRFIAEDNCYSVEPIQNRIIFFQSSNMHEVAKVICPSGNFRHGRFTLNGWIHK